MNVWDNRRLYDIALRSQILVEGVKTGLNRDLSAILREMMDDISGVLSRTEYRKLSEISKQQLQKLLLELRRVQGRAYSRYTEVAMETLRDFCDAQHSVQARVWAYSKFSLDAEKEGKLDEEETRRKQQELAEDEDKAFAFILAFGAGAVAGLATATQADRIWALVTNTPMQATGAYVLPAIQSVTVALQNRIENQVRRHWATPGVEATALIDALSNLPAQGGSSALATGIRGSTATASTVMQHAAQAISEAVSSALFGMYRWISIIDNRTSDICLRLNRRVFVYGRGPVPPAHTHCRSHIVPLTDDSAMQQESLYDWLRSQPRGILDYVLGSETAQRLLDGTIDAEHVSVIRFPALTPAQYAQTVQTIIQ